MCLYIQSNSKIQARVLGGGGKSVGLRAGAKQILIDSEALMQDEGSEVRQV